LNLIWEDLQYYEKNCMMLFKKFNMTLIFYWKQNFFIFFEIASCSLHGTDEYHLSIFFKLSETFQNLPTVAAENYLVHGLYKELHCKNFKIVLVTSIWFNNSSYTRITNLYIVWHTNSNNVIDSVYDARIESN